MKELDTSGLLVDTFKPWFLDLSLDFMFTWALLLYYYIWFIFSRSTIKLEVTFYYIFTGSFTGSVSFNSRKRLKKFGSIISYLDICFWGSGDLSAFYSISSVWFFLSLDVLVSFIDGEILGDFLSCNVPVFIVFLGDW